jgi:hypothetical protein
MSEQDSVRLVSAPISLVYDMSDVNEEGFEREYNTLSESDDDPISQWLKLARAKGETSNSDQVLLNLVVELHRKIDSLEKFLKNEKPNRVSLVNSSMIESIGFGYFKLKNDDLQEAKEYYGRIDMPVHPRRDIAVFFKAESSNLCKIIRMHERDEKEWNSYVVARERVMIREMRSNNE